MNGIQWILFILIIQIVHFLGTWKLYKAAGEAPWKAIVPSIQCDCFVKNNSPTQVVGFSSISSSHQPYDVHGIVDRHCQTFWKK